MYPIQSVNYNYNINLITLHYMKNNIYISSIGLLLLSSLLFFFACERKENMPNPKDDLTVEDGVLRFSSIDMFEKTLSLLQKDQSALDEWEKRFPGFTSMRTAFNNLTEEDIVKISTTGSTKGYEGYLSLIGEGENREAVMNTDDNLLGTVLNKEGIVFIGEDMYKVTYQKLIKVGDYKANKNIIANLGDVTSSNLPKGIQVYAVEHQYSERPVNAAARTETCIREYWHGGALCCKKRFVGQLYTTKVGVLYSSVGGKTIHQRRTSGIWWADKIPEIRLQITGNFTQFIPGGVINNIPVNYDTGIQYDDSGDKNNFEFCVNFKCEFQINSMSSYHYGRCDDNVVRECRLTW